MRHTNRLLDLSTKLTAIIVIGTTAMSALFTWLLPLPYPWWSNAVLVMGCIGFLGAVAGYIGYLYPATNAAFSKKMWACCLSVLISVTFVVVITFFILFNFVTGV